MLFSFFTKQKQDKSLALLVDIGSASVGAALVKIEAGKPPHILSTVREDIPFQETLSSARFLMAMNHTLERALKNIQLKNKGYGAPEHTFCTLSSPWFMIKSRTIEVSRTELFEVTDKALDVFLNEDIERLKEDLKETLPPEDIEIIEKKIIQMKFNGYEIKNPYGQKIRQMTIASAVALSSKHVIEGIKQRIGQFFHTSAVHFGAFPVAAFSAVRDMFPEKQNFIFVDVTGEATDVSLIRNDLLLGTISFSRGKNFFIREISAALKTPHQEAASLFSMFLADALEERKREQIGNIVAQGKEEWATRFNKAIISFPDGEALPSLAFLTADIDMASFFTGIIATAHPGALLRGALETTYLGEPLMTTFTSFESEVIRDPFLSVEALLAAKIMRPSIEKK